MSRIRRSATCRGPTTARRASASMPTGFRRSAAISRRKRMPEERIVLAVGDSFTFGDEVRDDETWPAHLQQLLGRRVLNAGVSGYGFDQIVMRAERVVADKHPSAVVVSFIADDVLRTEMRRRWGAEKPYFDIQTGRWSCATSGAAAARSAHHARLLSAPSAIPSARLRPERLDLTDNWFSDHVRVHPRGHGGENLLPADRPARRPAATQRRAHPGRRAVRSGRLAGSASPPSNAASPKACSTAAASRASTCSTPSTRSRRWRQGPARPLYGLWHMNDAGNRLTARLIAAALGSARHLMGGRIALLIGSILFSLVALELGLRATHGWDGLTHWPNLVEQARNLGWVTRQRQPRRARSAARLRRPAQSRPSDGMSYDARSLRRTPAPEGMALAEPPILVIGDSYAHGDEVADRETWAAQLQPLIRRRVVNGGDERLRHRPDGAARRDPGARGEARRDRHELHRRRRAAHRDEARVGGGEAVFRAGRRRAGRTQRAGAAAARSGLDARYLAAPARPLLLFDTVLQPSTGTTNGTSTTSARCRATPARSSSARCSSGWRRSACRCWWSRNTIPITGWTTATAGDAPRRRLGTGLRDRAGLATLDLFDTIDEAVRARPADDLSPAPSGPAGTEITARADRRPSWQNALTSPRMAR